MNKLFNDSWRFLKTDVKATYPEVCGLLASFSEVVIPHDWLIHDSNNLYETSAGWYYKEFSITEKASHTFLRFDGVYMDSEVYVNDAKAGEWKYGYSTFTFEITDYLQCGLNKVMVHVKHEAPNSRWYSGAGIFRNIHYIEKGAFYLPEDGNYVNITPLENGDYRIDIETEAYLPFLEDERPSNVRMIKPVYSLVSPSGKKILLGEADYVGIVEDIYAERFEKAKAEVSFEAMEGYREPDFHEEYKHRGLYKLSATVKDPEIWDIENPKLYSMFTGLLYVGTDQSLPELLDDCTCNIGFKNIKFDFEEGLILNGRHIKLNGVCEHHDLGSLGAAFSKEAMKRKFRILKKMGVNAVRTSHNMPDPQLMDLCDEMGILVDNEAFDMWEMTITTYDYARFFPQWSSRDVASWIRRDRNHVSNIMWSIGNEIPDTVNGDKGVPITKHLVANVLLHDPYRNSRATIGSNFMEWEKARNCTDVFKVAGYNYAERLYEEQHKEHPDWIIYGSETSSMVTSRGVYHFPLEESIMSDEDGQCSSIGNSTSSWGARNVESCVYLDRDIKFSLGQFLWSGFDYIGEPTPYNYKNSYFGQIDTAGFPKDQYYCFMAEWTSQEENPFVHLYPYWNWNEGQLIDVRACSTGKAVELFLNGKSLGKKHINHEQGKELVPTWKVPYEKGEIVAVAYDETGKEIARDRHVTFKDSYKPVVFVEHHAQYKVLKNDCKTEAKIAIEPDGRNLYFVDISMADIDGNIVENAMDYVTVKVQNGKLKTLDNGDSTDYDSFCSDTRKLFNGKLLAIVEPEGQDTVIVTVTRITEEKVPVRRLEIIPEKELSFSPDYKECIVKINVLPENATDKTVEVKAVNSSAIEIDSVKAEKISENEYRITALGNSKGYLRATSKSGTDMVRIISQLELSAEGLGEINMNPYQFVSAGLYSKLIGEVGSGNDKGVCFAPHGDSGVTFNQVDFGTGSDELTLTLFTFSDNEYTVRLYEGDYTEGNAKLLDNLVYKQASNWNEYKPQVFKLPKRLSGVKTISFVTDTMLHMKGFEFTKQERAYSRLDAASFDNIMGDSYKVNESTVTGIGNNVCLTFNNMDFGEKGTSRIVIEGTTPLDEMTIRLQFTPENGEPQIQSFSVKGGLEMHDCAINTLSGKGKVEFIFLPGTQFDFNAFTFK